MLECRAIQFNHCSKHFHGDDTDACHQAIAGLLASTGKRDPSVRSFIRCTVNKWLTATRLPTGPVMLH